MKTFKPLITQVFYITIFIISFSQCKQSNSIEPNKTLKTSVSSDNRFKAEIKTDKTFSYYLLTIKNMDGDSSVMFDTMICVKGYHEPIFNLSWKDEQSLLEISVDNDFGENVHFYSYDFTTNKMIENK